MFDAQLRPLIDRLLNPIGRGLVTLGVTANQVTMIGAAFGLIAAGCVAAGLFYPALWFVIANRVIDGLDGAVARASRSSDFGGYLDIVSDFIFYSAIPLAFAVAQPETALAAAFLIFSFIGTCRGAARNRACSSVPDFQFYWHRHQFSWLCHSCRKTSCHHPNPRQKGILLSWRFDRRNRNDTAVPCNAGLA